MSTFGTIKGRVSDEMKRGELSASSTAVQASVLSAIAHLERRRFPWNEFEGASATASSSALYVPFSRFTQDGGVTFISPLIIDSLKVQVNGRDYQLLRKTFRHIDAIDADEWYGYPDWYAVHGQQIRLYPGPNQEMVLSLSGVKRLTEVSISASASATNAWVTDGEELVRLIAKSMLFRDELRAPDLAGYFRQEANDIMREIQRETIAKTSSGRLTPSY